MIAVMALSSLTGCASKTLPEPVVTPETHPYTDCYAPIKSLRDSENSTATVIYAGVGVALGCAGGALLGLLLTGDWRGALAGCIGGGIGGGAIGAYYAERQKETDENARMAAYLRDLDGDISNLTLVTASARKAIQCYNDKFYLARTQYKKKQITREEFAHKYREIRKGMQEAQQILGATAQEAQTIDAAYTNAFAKEGITTGSSKPSVRKNINDKHVTLKQKVRETEQIKADAAKETNAHDEFMRANGFHVL